ncbi:MAG: lysophospholipid acyltransferase family protein [Ferruginibacter sp.]
MNFLKNIFARIWAFWALVSFVVTFLIIFIPSMLSYLFKDEVKGQNYFIWVSRIWMQSWLYMIACPVKVVGRENFEKNKNYVIVYNHNAFLDVPLSAPFVPGGNKTIAKASFGKFPIFGWFYKRGGIMVDRNKENSRTKSYEAMRATLKKGIHMCIYPEGTRNRTGNPLKPFYDGAFKLAIDAKKEIIPCVILGTNRAMPVNKSFYLLPKRLKMIFLPAVSSDNIDTKSLNEKVFDIMYDVFTKNQ